MAFKGTWEEWVARRPRRVEAKRGKNRGSWWGKLLGFKKTDEKEDKEEEKGESTKRRRFLIGTRVEFGEGHKSNHVRNFEIFTPFGSWSAHDSFSKNRFSRWLYLQGCGKRWESACDSGERKLAAGQRGRHVHCFRGGWREWK